MERIYAIILRSGGCGPSLWEENRRREKSQPLQHKNNPGDDRHFVSAFKQGFGPAFFFRADAVHNGTCRGVSPFSCPTANCNYRLRSLCSIAASRRISSRMAWQTLTKGAIKFCVLTTCWPVERAPCFLAHRYKAGVNWWIHTWKGLPPRLEHGSAPPFGRKSKRTRTAREFDGDHHPAAAPRLRPQVKAGQVG